MTLRTDPITGRMRLMAPGRAERLRANGHGCPFCAGNEHDTPHETGRIVSRDGAWRARSFPNLFPLTDPHEVVVPTPRHVTRWRDLTLPELEAGMRLLLERRAALIREGRYVHAFVNDGAQAGASIPHVHAQLVSVPAAGHAEALTAGVRPPSCAFCELLGDEQAPLVVERGLRYAIIAHPLPRLGGALLIIPTDHDDDVDDQPPAELAALLHRALHAVDEDVALNLWLVANRERRAHWYLELQPRTAQLAGVELALAIAVVAQDPVETASRARERLAIVHPGVAGGRELL